MTDLCAPTEKLLRARMPEKILIHGAKAIKEYLEKKGKGNESPEEQQKDDSADR